MNNDKLDLLHRSGILSALDIHFAGFLARLAGNGGVELMLAAALASCHTRQGHICVDLSRIAGKSWPGGEDDGESVNCPKLEDWLESLRQSPVVGDPGEYRPMVLDHASRLYLYRYWDYQERLAGAIKKRTLSGEPVDVPLLKDGLSRLFPNHSAGEIDFQKVAAFTVLTKKFCVISGGPGTGKTTTVARILALIIEQTMPKKLRISLAAPTGKAAARLQEAIGRVKTVLNCSEDVKEAIPDEASTIHRLLGSIPDSPYFRHNEQNPLTVEVMVVDEASMVDLALMSKLVQALPANAKLILLGDKDQLASVEAGAVLGDICDTGNEHGFSTAFCETLKKVAGCDIPPGPNEEPEFGLNDCMVHLQKSYRFGPESGIGAVGKAANEGNTSKALTLLREEQYKDISWVDLPQFNDLPSALTHTIIEEFADCLTFHDPREVFQRFERFRILGALREGPYGVVALNTLVEQILKEKELIEPNKVWYRGRPLMISRNDYNLRLFNGDVGLVLPDPEADNDLRAFFPSTDGTLRRFHPLRLPEHETVYAMTVHKSQGSEFDRILLILPERDSPVLSRELIYTAITRARKGVEIWGREGVFHSAISRRIERMSGLRDELWSHGA